MNNLIQNNKKVRVFSSCILFMSVVLIIIFSQSTKAVGASSPTPFIDTPNVKSIIVKQAVVKDVFKKYPYLQVQKVEQYNELKELVEDMEQDKLEQRREELSKPMIEYKLKLKQEERERKERIKAEQERQRLENIRLEKLRLERLAERKKAQEQERTRTKQASVSQSTVGRTVTVTATAYTSYCNTGCIGITATGVNVKNSVTYNGARIIAVDPSVIPLHSKVKVYPNDRPPFIAYAKDTGGDIKGNRIDFLISVNNTNVAGNFGRQHGVKVEILREGN